MSFLKKLKLAFSGIMYCVKNEKHMVFHILAMYYVSVFAYAYGLEPMSWAILLLTFSSVISSELINTALERICSLNTEMYNSVVKIIKDVASGAVLVCAVFSVGVAFCLFCDVLKIVDALKTVINTPGLIFICAVPLLIFTFKYLFSFIKKHRVERLKRKV